MAESVRHLLHLGPGVRLIGTVGVCLGLASGPESVAEKEWENVFKKLSRTGEATPEMAEAAMDLAKLTGLENMPEASVIWTDEFTPAPK